jgi:hypothetical protein
VVSGLTLAPGQAVTIIIPVIVDVGQPAGTVISNTAVFTSAESANATLTVLVEGVGFRLFLPLVRR